MAVASTGQTFTINGVKVQFPHKPYPSQFSMMDKIIKGVDRSQNCLLESPTGSGKSLALLCSALAWQRAEREKIYAEQKANEKGSDCCKCNVVETSDTGQPEVTLISAANQIPPPATPSGCIDIEDDDFRKENKTFRTQQGRPVVESGTSGAGAPDTEAKPPWTMEVKSKCECTCGSEQKPSRRVPKIWFGTRTHKQIAQITRELGKTEYRGVRMCILSSREHTCIHPHVSKSSHKNEDCKRLLEDGFCKFNENVRRKISHRAVQEKVKDAWDLEEFVGFCRKEKACPYFGSRQLKDGAEIIFCPYNYLIDPLIRETMEIDLKEQVVILDEGHNMEDSAREAASFSLTEQDLKDAHLDLARVMSQREQSGTSECRLLRDFVTSLTQLIETNGQYVKADSFDQGSKSWSGMEMVAQLRNCGIDTATMDNLRKAFVKIVADQNDPEKRDQHDVIKLKTATLKLIEGIMMVLQFIFRDNMRYMNDYRVAMVRTTVYVQQDTADVWLQAGGGRRRGHRAPQTCFALHFWCLNPAVAFREMGEPARSIILTSGTLSPMNTFQSELGVPFPIQLEASHVVGKSQVWVGTVGKGPRGCALLGNYQTSETFAYQDDVGELVLGVCETVPHGVLCFLPSYKSLDKLTKRWRTTGLYDRLLQKKVVMSEPKASEKVDFDQLLKSFYEVIEESEQEEGSERTGALFLAVCRGKVSEGMDFADNNARAVITVGIPYPNIKDPQVDAKKKYNDRYCQDRGLLPGSEWYEIQAFRALNQALGRCIRHRNDWGALILVDSRFSRNQQKYTKGLSKWVRQRVAHHSTYVEARQSLRFYTQQRHANPVTHDVSVLNQSAVSQSPANDPTTTASPTPFKTPFREMPSSTPQSSLLLPQNASTSAIEESASPYFGRKTTNVFGGAESSVVGGGFFSVSQKVMNQSQTCSQSASQSNALSQTCQLNNLQTAVNQSHVIAQQLNDQPIGHPKVLQNMNGHNVILQQPVLQNTSHTLVNNINPEVNQIVNSQPPQVIVRPQIQNGGHIPQLIPGQDVILVNPTPKQPVSNGDLSSEIRIDDKEGYIDLTEDDFQPRDSSTQLPGKMSRNRKLSKSRSGSKVGQKSKMNSTIFDRNESQSGEIPLSQGVKGILDFTSPCVDKLKTKESSKKLSLKDKLQRFAYPRTKTAQEGASEIVNNATDKRTSLDSPLHKETAFSSKSVPQINGFAARPVMDVDNSKNKAFESTNCKNSIRPTDGTENVKSEKITKTNVACNRNASNDLVERSDSPDLFAESDTEHMTCDSELDDVIRCVKTEIETAGNPVKMESETGWNHMGVKSEFNTIKQESVYENMNHIKHESVSSAEKDVNKQEFKKENKQEKVQNKSQLKVTVERFDDDNEISSRAPFENRGQRTNTRLATKSQRAHVKQNSDVGDFESKTSKKSNRTRSNLRNEEQEKSRDKPTMTEKVEVVTDENIGEENQEVLKTRRGKRRRPLASMPVRKKSKKGKGIDFLDELESAEDQGKHTIGCKSCKNQLYTNISEIVRPERCPAFVRSKCGEDSPVLLHNTAASSSKLSRLKLSLNQEYPVTSLYSEEDGCCYRYVCCKCGPCVVGVEVKLIGERHHPTLSLNQVWLFPRAVTLVEGSS